MRILKPAVVTAALLLGALLCGTAAGQVRTSEPAASASGASLMSASDVQAYAKLPVCTLSADGKRLAVEPCRTAPARVPMPRRPVNQIVQRMPSAKLAPQVGMPAMPPLQSLQSLTHPPHAPVPMAGCDAAGCFDARGVRYNNAPAGSIVAPPGKPCNRGGTAGQCQ